eukprot:CAMPEP_0170177188 /NCGR_PEP_ID=MMETSP0040_2-20121228/9892_1 /TAXON_ID=641309 /ORGANISM="Lotharella oceanica, Strain CCMP622" /LENGTH=450 /DNA_ID=CAMNT_0010419743 /DNA_START=45 /DNA_END=1397 /DNA_ORIENTATION=-
MTSPSMTSTMSSNTGSPSSNKKHSRKAHDRKIHDTSIAYIAPTERVVLDCNLCSDLLYHSWRCKTAGIDPAWIKKDNVMRVECKNMSVSSFIEEIESKHKPVILSGLMEGWACMNKWSNEYLINAMGSKTFSVGGYQMPLKNYLSYMSSEPLDDQSLYLFDPNFAKTCPSMEKDYSVPPFFSNQRDLFSVLQNTRPNYRWLIMGPKRSGSTFHKDPNGTSAWNACVRGVKKWILLPPTVNPPGVHSSEDGVDVTSPVSLTEWFINFYHTLPSLGVESIEFIQRPGDMVFVPTQWWHCVLNLTECIAITQNYVSTCNLNRVLYATRLPELVSGVPHAQRRNFRNNFLKALLEKYPETYKKYCCPQNTNGSSSNSRNHQLAALFSKQQQQQVENKPNDDPAVAAAAAGDASGDHDNDDDNHRRSYAHGNNKPSSNAFTFSFSIDPEDPDYEG